MCLPRFQLPSEVPYGASSTRALSWSTDAGTSSVPIRGGEIDGVSEPYDLRAGKPPEGNLDGGDGDPGGEGFREVLEILSETSVAPKLG